MLYNNLYYPEGTHTVELYNNNTLAVFYYFTKYSKIKLLPKYLNNKFIF